MKPFWRLSMAVNPHGYGERGRGEETAHKERGKVESGMKRDERGAFAEERGRVKRRRRPMRENSGRERESWFGKRSKKEGGGEGKMQLLLARMGAKGCLLSKMKWKKEEGREGRSGREGEKEKEREE